MRVLFALLTDALPWLSDPAQDAVRAREWVATGSPVKGGASLVPVEVHAWSDAQAATFEWSVSTRALRRGSEQSGTADRLFTCRCPRADVGAEQTKQFLMRWSNTFADDDNPLLLASSDDDDDDNAGMDEDVDMRDVADEEEEEEPTSNRV